MLVAEFLIQVEVTSKEPLSASGRTPAELSADLDEWRVRQIAFLKRVPVDSCEDPDVEEIPGESHPSWCSKGKIQRAAAQHHVHAMDIQLASVVPGGLSRFVPKDGDDKLPLPKRPLLVTCEDRGPTNYCAKWWRLYKLKLRECHREDPWHNVWNAALKACGDGGFGPLMKICAVNHSIAHGPFGSWAFFHEIKAGAIDLQRLLRAGDPVLKENVRQCLLDEGIMEITDEIIEEFIERFLDMACFQYVGPKTALCRFFEWFPAQGWYSLCWHARKMVLTYLAMKRGYELKTFETSKFKEIVDKISTPSEAAGAGEAEAPKTVKQSTSSCMSEIRRLRDACVNGIHFSYKVHSEPRYICESRMCLRAVAPMHEWYQHHSHSLRGVDAQVQFSMEMTTGEAVLPWMNKVWTLLEDTLALEQMGFHVMELGNDVQYQRWTTTCPQLIQQDDMMVKLVRLIFFVLRRWLWELINYSHCYPGGFAGLLHKDIAVRTERLNHMRRTWAAYAKLKTSTTPWAKKVLQSSPLKQTHVLDVFEDLNAVGFTHVTPTVRET